MAIATPKTERAITTVTTKEISVLFTIPPRLKVLLVSTSRVATTPTQLRIQSVVPLVIVVVSVSVVDRKRLILWFGQPKNFWGKRDSLTTVATKTDLSITIKH